MGIIGVIPQADWPTDALDLDVSKTEIQSLDNVEEDGRYIPIYRGSDIQKQVCPYILSKSQAT